jgi:hypothetical protein
MYAYRVSFQGCIYIFSPGWCYVLECIQNKHYLMQDVPSVVAITINETTVKQSFYQLKWTRGNVCGKGRVGYWVKGQWDEWMGWMNKVNFTSPSDSVCLKIDILESSSLIQSSPVQWLLTDIILWTFHQVRFSWSIPFKVDHHKKRHQKQTAWGGPKDEWSIANRQPHTVPQGWHSLMHAMHIRADTAG